jgi:hypothetical protein
MAATPYQVFRPLQLTPAASVLLALPLLRRASRTHAHTHARAHAQQGMLVRHYYRRRTCTSRDGLAHPRVPALAAFTGSSSPPFPPRRRVGPAKRERACPPVAIADTPARPPSMHTRMLQTNAARSATPCILPARRRPSNPPAFGTAPSRSPGPAHMDTSWYPPLPGRGPSTHLRSAPLTDILAQSAAADGRMKSPSSAAHFLTDGRRSRRGRR